ncbi:MAG: hypothetical protein QM495_01380 [Lutibacter sp.]|uniref:hypothetical protein n=1 Tax=Lutibacter sp. TaxID=1925666 RepID=UPI00385EEF5F
MIFKYGYIVIYVIILSVGLFHFKKYKHSFLLKMWLYFLIYSFLTECITRYIVEIYRVRTITLNNTWFILNVLFYMFFYLFNIKNLVRKRLIISLSSVFILMNIIMSFYVDYTKEYFVYSNIIGQFFIVLSIMIYFVEVLKSEIILTIQKSLIFWISLGVLIFNIGLLPVFVIGELIDWQGIFKYIILSMNILMAASFITGFIVSKKEFNT